MCKKLSIIIMGLSLFVGTGQAMWGGQTTSNNDRMLELAKVMYETPNEFEAYVDKNYKGIDLGTQFNIFVISGSNNRFEPVFDKNKFTEASLKTNLFQMACYYNNLQIITLLLTKYKQGHWKCSFVYDDLVAVVYSSTIYRLEESLIQELLDAVFHKKSFIQNLLFDCVQKRDDLVKSIKAVLTDTYHDPEGKGCVEAQNLKKIQNVIEAYPINRGFIFTPSRLAVTAGIAAICLAVVGKIIHSWYTKPQEDDSEDEETEKLDSEHELTDEITA